MYVRRQQEQMEQKNLKHQPQQRLNTLKKQFGQKRQLFRNWYYISQKSITKFNKKNINLPMHQIQKTYNLRLYVHLILNHKNIRKMNMICTILQIKLIQSNYKAQRKQMFSLSDQLQKFNKVIFNKELDDAITIDDRFSGGGITIHDLIKQNNFIVNQLRKMKDVFSNYWQLNDKVYKTIIQYELSVANQQVKLKSMIHSMGNRIEESVKTIKDLHQNIVFQNQKSQNLFVEKYAPVKQELTQKVDQGQLFPLVRKIIDDYDNGSGQSQGQKSLGGNISGTQGQVKSPVPKRKNRNAAALTQQLQTFRAELQQTLNKLQQKILQNKGSIEVQAVKLHGTQAAVSRMKIEIQYAREDVKKLGEKQQAQNEMIKNFSDSLMKELRQKTSDSVWQTKLGQFNDMFVEKPLNRLKIEMNNSNDVFLKKLDQLPGKFDQVHGKIREVASQIPPIRQCIPPLEQKITIQREMLERLREDMNKSDSRIQQIQSQNKIQLSGKVNQLQKNVNSEIKEVKRILQESVNQIEIKVLKGVKIKFGGEIKEITNKALEQKQKLIKVTERVKSSEQKIGHLKDLVSKKANFTDLLLESQKKVNKAQVMEIKTLLQEQRDRSNLRINFDTSGNYEDNYGSTQRFRRKSLLTSRNLMTPPHSKNLQQDDSTKVFMCGFNELNLKQIRQDKKLLSLKRLNKSLRPTTANTINMHKKAI